MKHLIFSLYLLSFFSGVFSAIFLQILYYRYRTNTLKSLFQFIMNLTLLEMIYMIIVYSQVFNRVIRLYPDAVFLLITSIIDVLLILTGYRLYRKILTQHGKYPKILPIVFGLIIILSFPGIILFKPRLAADFRDMVLSAYFAFLNISIIANKGKVDTEVFYYFSKFIRIVILSIIGIFSGIILKRLPVFRNFPHAAFTFSIAFLFLNISMYYYIRKHLVNEINQLSPDLGTCYGLTRRELEIVQFVNYGLSNPQIAERLFISTRTVSNHLYAIFKKTGVKSRYELMALNGKQTTKKTETRNAESVKTLKAEQFLPEP